MTQVLRGWKIQKRDLGDVEEKMQERAEISRNSTAAKSLKINRRTGGKESYCSLHLSEYILTMWSGPGP